MNKQFQQKYNKSGLTFTAHSGRGAINIGAILGFLGIGVLLYAVTVFALRVYRLDVRSPTGYKDAFGPTALGIGLLVGHVIYLIVN